MKKTKWETPEIIVIVRSKPEEAVLQLCKFPGINGPTGGGAANCNAQGNPPNFCNERFPS